MNIKGNHKCFTEYTICNAEIQLSFDHLNSILTRRVLLKPLLNELKTFILT